MRAIVVSEPGGPEVLRISEIETPVIGPDDMLVDVRAAGLNRADLIQRRGRYPAPPGAPGDVLGLEMAGVVAKVGARVRGLSPGDRVFGLLPGGGYAERVALHGRMALPIPEGLSFVEAAAIPEAFITAYDALFNLAKLRMGEAALIHAVASGVGTAALQLARESGATTFGTAGSDEKLRRAAELGLDHGVNYKEEDFLDAVKERTKGRGVDVVLDVVGAPYWERNVRSLGPLGRLVLVGTMGGAEATIRLGDLMSRRLRVFGTALRVRQLEEKIALSRQLETNVMPLVAAGRIKPIVDRVFPLEEAAAAHNYMEANLNFGKIILTL